MRALNWFSRNVDVKVASDDHERHRLNATLRSVFVDHCRQVIGIALQRAICTQITNNVKVRKGVGSTRDYVDLCSSLPLTGRLLSAA